MELTQTKTERLLSALTNGEQLTAKQITQRFKLANPTAAVSNLRLNGGYAIYLNEHSDDRGRKTYKYRLGRPSRAVVAAGYRALGASAA